MKINCLQKLGKIKAVLQALNAKFQNTRINTTIYGAVCVCILVSRVLGIPLVYEWVHYYYGGSYIFVKTIHCLCVAGPENIYMT